MRSPHIPAKFAWSFMQILARSTPYGEVTLVGAVHAAKIPYAHRHAGVFCQFAVARLREIEPEYMQVR